MKVSVITTVLNCVNTIEYTIQSVSSQSHVDIEHIIIDGQSTDGTLEILQRYSEQVSLIVSEPDSGIYHGMNKGLALATGDVVGFLNADDYYQHENVISDLCAVFDDPTIQGCYADLVYVDPLQVDKIIRYWKSKDYQPGLFEKGWMPAHPTFYVRREVYKEHGVFNIDYKFHADLEITARFIAVKKIKTRYVPDIWVRMRTGGATNRSLKNIIKGNLESYKACKKLGLKITPLYFITKTLMRLPQLFLKPAFR